jgi:hypothetical protein
VKDALAICEEQYDDAAATKRIIQNIQTRKHEGIG